MRTYLGLWLWSSEGEPGGILKFRKFLSITMHARARFSTSHRSMFVVATAGKRAWYMPEGIGYTWQALEHCAIRRRL